MMDDERLGYSQCNFPQLLSLRSVHQASFHIEYMHLSKKKYPEPYLCQKPNLSFGFSLK